MMDCLLIFFSYTLNFTLLLNFILTVAFERMLTATTSTPTREESGTQTNDTSTMENHNTRASDKNVKNNTPVVTDEPPMATFQSNDGLLAAPSTKTPAAKTKKTSILSSDQQQILAETIALVRTLEEKAVARRKRLSSIEDRRKEREDARRKARTAKYERLRKLEASCSRSLQTYTASASYQKHAQ